MRVAALKVEAPSSGGDSSPPGLYHRQGDHVPGSGFLDFSIHDETGQLPANNIEKQLF